MSTTAAEELTYLARRRRSVRRFKKGETITRDVLTNIAEVGRWAPTGANAQPWHLIIVDDPIKKQEVLEVFLRQSQRLVDHAKGFPAVKKTYLANTAATFIILGDPRWKVCFPQGTSVQWAADYAANSERIYSVSLGAVIQNVQLAVTAYGLTSAWLSGGGESQTNGELAAALGYPDFMEAIGTIPIGYPEKGVTSRYRRPLDQLVHWNGYDHCKLRPNEMVNFYVEKLRPFAMYRGSENLLDWEDSLEKLGPWLDAFTGPAPNSRT